MPPTPTPQVSISKAPVVLNFSVDADKLVQAASLADKEAERTRLRPLILAALERAGFTSDQRAGFVLTFAGGPNSRDDTEIATQVNALLREVMPTLFDTDTVMRPYIDLIAARGAIEVQVFVFTVR